MPHPDFALGSGNYYDYDKVHEGGFLVALQDKTGAGKADVIERFGETERTGGHGGVGIGMYKAAPHTVRCTLNYSAIATFELLWRSTTATGSRSNSRVTMTGG